jgi:hypothetical protein
MRTIGKFGFLVALMGFFMPMACDQNAFQLIEYVDAPIPALIVILFILALVGALIGLLLLVKKAVPVAVDWVVILGSVVCGIMLSSQVSKNGVGLGDLQYGAYVITAGLCFAILLQILAMVGGVSSAASKKMNPSVALLIALIVGAVLVLYTLIRMRGYSFSYLPWYIGLAAVVFNVLAWKGKKGSFALIAGILYGVATLLAILRILQIGTMIITRAGEIIVLFIFPAIFCFIASARLKKG